MNITYSFEDEKIGLVKKTITTESVELFYLDDLFDEINQIDISVKKLMDRKQALLDKFSSIKEALSSNEAAVTKIDELSLSVNNFTISIAEKEDDSGSTGATGITGSSEVASA